MASSCISIFPDALERIQDFVRELLAVKGELTGKVLWEEFPATGDPEGRHFKPYHQTMDERIRTEFEAYYPAPLDRHCVIKSLPSEDGVVIFFRDTTERRLSEQAMEAQQRLLASCSRARWWQRGPSIR